jgi:hypothetical protein
MMNEHEWRGGAHCVGGKIEKAIGWLIHRRRD